jgi:hypothetical protein
MANVIVIKKGAGVPAPDQLQEAELALDVTDGALYSKLQDGIIHHLNDGADDVDLSDYVLEAPDDGALYGRQSKDWVEVVIPDGGTGSSVHIGDTPPDSPQEGQQWMEVPADGDATMWIYDGANWLQQPGGKDGADGADGTNGVDGLWTDNGDTTISYMDGNVGIGTAPSFPLHVNAGATNAAARIETTNEYSLLNFDNAGTTASPPSIGSHNDDFRVATAGSLRMTINADGNVGIGVADSPYLLHARSDSGPRIRVENTQDSQASFDLKTGSRETRLITDPNSILRIYDQDSNSDKFIINADGNVGVNATPDTLQGLNVKSGHNIGFAEAGGAYANMFRQDSSGALILAQGYKRHASAGGFASSAAGNFGKSAIAIANTIKFYVDNYTDVPVGTKVEPTEVMSIDYNGRVDITGSLYVNGTPKIGYQELITTLVTLRQATMDETQDIRESLRSAIDELVAGLEQEIANMPAPEASTQEISE